MLRAATETARAFNLAIVAGRGAPIDRSRIDAAVMACLRAAEMCPEDPTPWVSLMSVARLYPDGMRRSELARWWDGLHERDPYSVEGHLQVLHYYSAHWHGTHGLMCDFARDAAGVAPPGSPLPVLVQYARVEEYRFMLEAARGDPRLVRSAGQHWDNDGAVHDVQRTWHCWFGSSQDGHVPPGRVRDLNHLTHAACYAGLTGIAATLFRILDRRATRAPWASTGDPERELVRWRRNVVEQR